MSRCASGSSSSSTSGRRARQAASATSLRWPPESSRGRHVGAWRRRCPSARRWPSASPSARSPPASVQRGEQALVVRERAASSRRGRRRAPGRPAARSAACSSASSIASSGRAARTVARASRSSPSTICGRCASTRPRRRVTVPASASSRPARMRISVDLPPPLGPRMPIREPASTSRSAPRRMLRPPKDLVIPRAANCGTDDIPLASRLAARAAIEPAAPPTPDGTSNPHRPRRSRAPRSRGRGGRRHARRARAGGGRRLGRRRRTSCPSCPASVKWVQLQSAGIEPWVERVRATPGCHVHDRGRRVRVAGRRARARRC